MKYRTTKYHFKIFTKEVHKWIEILGLKDYILFVEHEVIKKDPPPLAEIYYEVVDRSAIIILNENWFKEVNNREVRKCAFHEVQELLLGELATMSEGPEVSQDIVDRAIHAVIRRLENSFFNMVKKK